MNDNSWGTIAEWVAIAITLAFSILGFIRAGKSNGIAANSVQVAKDARRLAAEANQISQESNQIAEGSARSATHAVTEAKRSADTAERVEGRQTERNNVLWVVPKKPATSRWEARNSGVDVAFEAYVVLQVDGHRIVSEPSDVGPGGSITIDTSDIYRAKIARNEASISQMSRSGIAYFPSSNLKIKHQIVWRTQMGSWHTFEGE